MAKRELAKIKKKLELNRDDISCLGTVCLDLEKIVISQPSFAPEVLEIVTQRWRSGRNRIHSVGKSYGVLGRVARAKPELAPQVVETIKESLASRYHDSSARFYAYEAISDAAIANPSLVPEILNNFKDMHKHMAKIVKARPEFALQVLEIVKEDLKSFNDYHNKKDSMVESRRYRSTHEPSIDEYIDKQRFEHGGYFLSTSYGILESVAEANPELTNQVVETIGEGLKSKENTDSSCYDAYHILRNIAEKKPEHASKITKIITEKIKDSSKLNRTDEYELQLRGAYKALSKIKSDLLQLKMDKLHEKLGEKVGKTADSTTGEVSSEHRKIAQAQLNISKNIMSRKKQNEG